MRQTLCFIVLFALSASTLSLQPPHDAILEKCKIDRPVTEELLSGLHSNPEPLLRDPETRCFAACILTENKTLNPDGTLNIISLIEYLPEDIVDREKIIEAFKSCANEKGVDSCETAYKTAVCINSKDLVRQIHPSE